MTRHLRIGKPYAALCVLTAMAAALAYSFTARGAETAPPKTKAQRPPKITASTVVKPVATLSDEEARAVSLAAGRIMHHAEQARLAIADKKKDEAIKQIGQGLKLVGIIENTVPKHQVTTTIKSGDVAYHDQELVAQRYVKVFDEQYVEDIVTPVVQAKKKGVEVKAGQEKPSLAAIAPIEDFSMLHHTTMKLDVVLAKRMLEDAQRSLKDGKYDDAAASLATLQARGVTFQSVEVEMPLAEAADNLKLAQVQMQEGKPVDALATLKLASDDLKQYEQLTGDNRAKDVRALRRDIDKLTHAFDQEKDLAKAMKKEERTIASWWNRAVKWFKK